MLKLRTFVNPMFYMMIITYQMTRKKLIYTLFLLALSSCDLTESHKQIRNEINQNMSGQSKPDSIKAKFDRISKEMRLDSIPKYIIDDENRLIEK